jgi:hypothetical protein
MSRILAAALLLAALPALLAQPRPSEPVPESAVSIAQDSIEVAFQPMINSTATTVTCDTACKAKGRGWDSLYAGTRNRTMCTVRVGSTMMVGEYMLQHRLPASGTATFYMHVMSCALHDMRQHNSPLLFESRSSAWVLMQISAAI